MKEPVDHIARPILPWRSSDAAITECGFRADAVKTITRPEFFQRVKDFGKQRTAMLTCMTCTQTAERWGTWDDDPRRAIDREITWEYGGHFRPRDDRGDLLKKELLAIAELIEAHREEFETILTTNEQRRMWLDRKAAHSQKKPTRGIIGL